MPRDHGGEGVHQRVEALDRQHTPARDQEPRVGGEVEFGQDRAPRRRAQGGQRRGRVEPGGDIEGDRRDLRRVAAETLRRPREDRGHRADPAHIPEDAPQLPLRGRGAGVAVGGVVVGLQHVAAV